eukprot:Hpha_TRINITY_DN3477_c0_g1::TRINITY_DN3477_c0_g1_i1::g.32537::m.32537
MGKDAYVFEGGVTKVVVQGALPSSCQFRLEWKRGDSSGIMGPCKPSVEIPTQVSTMPFPFSPHMKFTAHFYKEKAGWREKKLSLRLVAEGTGGRIMEMAKTEINIASYMHPGGGRQEVKDAAHQFRLGKEGRSAKLYLSAVLYPLNGAPL